MADSDAKERRNEDIQQKIVGVLRHDSQYNVDRDHVCEIQAIAYFSKPVQNSIVPYFEKTVFRKILLGNNKSEKHHRDDVVDVNVCRKYFRDRVLKRQNNNAGNVNKHGCRLFNAFQNGDYAFGLVISPVRQQRSVRQVAYAA